jgi:membrane protein implicated in regulation of membrane protease activity
MEMMQWVRIVTALLLILIQLLVPNVTVLYMAIGALVAALLTLVGFIPLIQIGAFLLFIIIGLLLRPRSKSSPIAVAETVFGLERLIGQEGVVVTTIDPERLTGRVRVDNEVWKAFSDTGELIPDGAQVIVLALQNDRLRVRPLPNEALPRRRPFGQD